VNETPTIRLSIGGTDVPTPESSAAAAAAVLGRQMVKGTGWTVATRLGVQGIGLVSTVILARLLVPSDFGLVALATTLSAALMALSEFGVDVVLIQKQNARRDLYDTAWTLSLIRNVVLAACLALFAPWTATFFDDGRIEAIVYCVALATVIDGFQNIGIVDFRKHMAFHKDFIFMVVGKLATTVITVLLAFVWPSYWALVIGILGGTGIRLVLSYGIHPFRPRLSLARWREIFHFSKWLVLNSVCAFLFNRSDTFIIGKMIGAQAVGVYGIAFEIANLATSNLVAPLRRAILPGYAKMADAPENLTKGFVDVFGLALVVGTPVALGIGLVAEPLVRVALGTQWLEAAPLIQVLCLYGFLGIVTAGSGPVYLAMARPHYLAWITGSTTMLMIPAIIFGADRAGLIGVAWAVTMTTAAAVVVDLWLVRRLLGLSFRRLVGAGWRPAAAAVLMAGVVMKVQAQWPIPDSVLAWSAQLAAAVGVGTMLYPLSVIVLWRIAGKPDGAERQLLFGVSSVMARLRKAWA
jgi:O-antigen/teichoic acid export membrane protein